MNRNTSTLPSLTALERFARGSVIPAHPLALGPDRTLDEVHQRALTRYYVDAGVGGLAVGVHITQFAIRDHGLYEPLLELTATEARTWASHELTLIAGVTGPTEQAVAEARTARDIGYTAAMVNVAAFRNRSEDEALEHCRAVARVMPVIGFALAPAIHGVHMSFDFWRRFAAIEEVVGIKVATFDRYRMLDVVRGVVAARAEDRITLYTGNDDHIVADLLTPFTVIRDGEPVTVHVRGGLLGHWSVWTKRAVELHERISALGDTADRPVDLLGLDARITDCNGAIYDAHHDFAGCIPGCLEVLRRQGLVRGIWCLDPSLGLGPGQLEDIDRVYVEHADLADDDFVAAHLDRWLTTESRSAVAEAGR